MIVNIVTNEPFPNGMAATNRIKCLAKAFLSAGVNCKVVVFRKNRLNDQYNASGVFEGIPYHYIGNTVRQSGGRIMGFLSSIFMQIKLLKYLKKNLKKGDFVYCFFGARNLLRKSIINITHRSSSYYISELCEYPFGTGKESTIVALQRKYALTRLFPMFDGVVAISDALKLLAQQYCSNKCVITKIPILVEYEKYNLPNNSKNTNHPFIFHSGTLTVQKDGILGMIEAFGLAIKQIKQEVLFVIAGTKETSPHQKEIDELIEKYDLYDRVHFIGYLTYEKLIKPLSEASLVILNKYPTQQNEYGFSTKLGEYLAAGKPVIITRVGEAMNWLTDGLNAYIIDPNDTSLLADSIIKAFNNDEVRDGIGLQAKLLCKKSFDYKAYGDKLSKLLSEINGI